MRVEFFAKVLVVAGAGGAVGGAGRTALAGFGAHGARLDHGIDLADDAAAASVIEQIVNIAGGCRCTA